jgi:restriction system protein
MGEDLPRQSRAGSSVRKGVYQLTDRGRSVIAAKPGRVDVAYLAKFPEFEEFRRE